jgi:hypothetical protein
MLYLLGTGRPQGVDFLKNTHGFVGVTESSMLFCVCIFDIFPLVPLRSDHGTEHGILCKKAPVLGLLLA